MKLSLRFNTAHARRHAAWAAFYRERDGFLQEQLRHAGQGLRFATYEAPGRERVDVWLTPEDLRYHHLILGQSGTGKSTLLLLLARAAYAQRQGATILDVHGDLASDCAAMAEQMGVAPLLLDFRRNDLPGWNPLAPAPGIESGRQVELVLGALKGLHPEEDRALGVRLEEVLRWTLRAAIESAEPATIVDLRTFFLVPIRRRKLLLTAKNETKAYFARIGPREEQYMTAVLARLEPLLAIRSVQRFLGATESSFDPASVLADGRSVIINLAKGYLGPATEIVGRLLVTGYQMAMFARESVPVARRTPYSLLLDEAHNLAGSLESFMTEGRKFAVYTAVCSQTEQLFAPRLRSILHGNAARHFFFRLEHDEARTLAPMFDALGSIRRERVRPYDDLDDPMLTPAEEVQARVRELARLPVGACYWVMKNKPFGARRIQIIPPPLSPPPSQP